MLRKALDLCEGEWLLCGTDDSRVRKTGQKIQTAALGRDPLSPAFHVNLVRGLRRRLGVLEWLRQTKVVIGFR